MTTTPTTHQAHQDITCEQAATLYCESRDRPLTGTEQAELHAHIEACKPCVIASGQLKALFGQLDSLLAGDE
ncbi:hypothetical protein [Sphaerotilus sp.]|jgi:hypothetical protein|uniref:hypothetical protein n=1 Tax=Sphaerotilus sp. TaxID=2093942 RepID=UPI0025F689CD|nr:hypothetical protein [Sphaerotilus sp.]